MLTINKAPYYLSLHRPYHQPLKMTRWVCEFVSIDESSTKSDISVEFYFYFIKRLSKLYSKSDKTYPGLPSRSSIENAVSKINSFEKSERHEKIAEILRNDRITSTEKQIYSSYKASSYYFNLAKDKLDLIDSQNQLSKYGLELLGMRTKSDLLQLGAAESHFFFERLIQNDFLLLISQLQFRKLEYKYRLSDSSIKEYFDFINKKFKILHFRFNEQSLGNYYKVRNTWLDNMKVLDKYSNIRKKYLSIIYSNTQYIEWYEVIQNRIREYENETFKATLSYEKSKSQFLKNYNLALKSGKHVQDFVNLYDVKGEMKISHEKFESFLNLYYEREKGRDHIFFSNIVSSIDRRKRFRIRGTSVIKIKIKHGTK